jgi:hypothetical protein
MSLVRYFRLRDSKAFILCDQKGRCALHLVATYSESSELLQSILETDQKMTKMRLPNVPFLVREVTALGLLCKRLEFPSFTEMVSSLIAVDNSVEVIFDGITGSLLSNKSFPSQSLLPVSEVNRLLNLFEVLLSANPEEAKYDNSLIFHRACFYLRGELGIAVVTLFLTKNSEGLRSFFSRYIPIHLAALNSSLDVLKFLYKAYPQTISISSIHGECNLLHLVIEGDRDGERIDPAHKLAKVKCLCDQCPHFMHMKTDLGFTPLHCVLFLHCDKKLDLDTVKFLCDKDETVVRDKCTPSDIDDLRFESLSLHLLITHRSLVSELSDEGDCFRLFLRFSGY